MSQIPYWTLPQFCWPNRIEYPPTWRVVFLLPLEDAELDQFMKRLVVVDNDWPDRPDAEPRRLLEMPWLYDIIPDTSIIAPIFTRGRKEPLIFIDTQSMEDDTAIIAYQVEGQENPQSLRVPINRANLLLSAAVEGKVVLDGQEFQPLEYESSAIMVSLQGIESRVEI